MTPGHARRAKRWSLLIALWLVLPSAAVAQSTDRGVLAGTVTDSSEKVMNGVEVTLSGRKLIGGLQTRNTDAAGRYRFAGLLPGEYELVVASPGFKTLRRSGIVVPVAATLTIDFAMEIAPLESALDVIAPSPTVDVRTASSSTRLDEPMLQNLPARRDVAKIVDWTPGVSEQTAFGSTQNSNALVADGVRLNDPNGGEPLIKLNYNWVQEVEVVALGASAEHGESTGVILNTVLRSGSNRFSGLFDYWTTQPRWVGNNTRELEARLQTTFTPREVFSWWDSTQQIGGPIVRDRLWFFSGFQYFRHQDRPAGVADGRSTETDPRFLVKLNAAATPRIRVEGFAETGVYDAKGWDLDRSTAPEASTTIHQLDRSWNGRLTWTLGRSTMLDARYSGYSSGDRWRPEPPATIEGPPHHFDLLTGRLTGNIWFFQSSQFRAQTAAATLTSYVDRRGGGSHEVKAGVEYAPTHAVTDFGFPGGREYYDYGGELRWLDIYSAPLIWTADLRRTGLFVQDRWVSSRLTIEPGLRVAFNRGAVPVLGTVFRTSPVSPRLGIAWDLNGDHRTVVRGHFGRYHDSFYSSRISNLDFTHDGYFTEFEPDGAGGLVETFKSEIRREYGVPDDLRHPYVEQYLLAVEREVAASFSVVAQYIRRATKDFIVLRDTGSTWAPVQRTDPGPDGLSQTADDGAALTLYNKTSSRQEFLVLANAPEAYRSYDGVQFVAKKRYAANWQLQASYTYSRARGNINNDPRSNAQLFEGGNPGTFVDPNGRINADGPLAFAFPHEVKLLGTYRVPAWGGVNVSSVWQFHSGMAWERRAAFPDVRGQTFNVKVEPRGSRRLPAIHALDVRVEKRSEERRVGKECRSRWSPYH